MMVNSDPDVGDLSLPSALVIRLSARIVAAYSDLNSYVTGLYTLGAGDFSPSRNDLVNARDFCIHSEYAKESLTMFEAHVIGSGRFVPNLIFVKSLLIGRLHCLHDRHVAGWPKPSMSLTATSVRNRDLCLDLLAPFWDLVARCNGT
jgi:hypothetical protein